VGVEALEERQLLTTFTVEHLGGTGPGSLRWAIAQSNASPGADVIGFAVSGTIRAGRSSLPAITDAVTIDGASAPGFAGTPVVTVDFQGGRGLRFARGSDGSTLSSLALVRAGGDGVTLDASRITVQGNYIGLLADGTTVAANRGDGVRINASSRGNLIGREDPVSSITYYNADAVSMQPVSGWQGIRQADAPGQFLITGTSGDAGLLYIGPISGAGGTSYAVNYPGAVATSVYGPDNLGNGVLRLVGTYRNGDQVVRGFVFEGTTADLANPANYRTIAEPGAQFTYVHSTMGGLAVGNYDGPTEEGTPIGPGRSFVYDLASDQFVADVAYPGATSTTSYGIWHNDRTSYTIVGGYSVAHAGGQALATSAGFMVDYDSATGQFSNWKSFQHTPTAGGDSIATHFEGISSVEKGVYTLSSGSALAGPGGGLIGSVASVRRQPDGSFGEATWVDLSYPGLDAAMTSDSVVGGQVVGLVLADTGTFTYQATIDVGFQLSNVIAGNCGNGVGIYGSHDNRVAMNYIGTDASGTAARGNRGSGVLLTSGASGNVIGGQATGGNDPTGGVFVRPPMGNLISGNRGDGVLINRGATRNLLSGNFIGTAASGAAPLGNRMDGVAIDRADGNLLIGCTFQQDPFVFYNVISGNGGNGLRITNSDDTIVQANFLGAGADNATVVGNRGDGLLISGDSRNTHVGGVIPLGNVISGNDRNGIEVRDRASGFLSFNTFAGLFAFAGAAPNRGDGILITSSGGDNVVRTSIVSGNLGDGIELGGNATGVQITDTAIGTNTDIQAALPNGGSGVKFSGRARGNAIGGFQPSIEPRVTISSNGRYGVEVVGSARDNAIFNANIGTTAEGSGDLGNALGGVLLGHGTSGTVIGGDAPPFFVKIANSGGDGLAVIGSRNNRVRGGEIVSNRGYGLYAEGDASGTVVRDAQISGNARGDVDLTNSRGVVYIP